jgi:AraC-like DNA-binding protein
MATGAIMAATSGLLPVLQEPAHDQFPASFGAFENPPISAVALKPRLAQFAHATSAEQGPYGRRIARLFKLETAQARTTALKTALLAATRLTSGIRGVGMTQPIPAEKAYIVSLQLRDLIGNEIWKAGRPIAKGPSPEGSITIVHLADEPVHLLPNAFDMLQFYIPEIAFSELAGDHAAPRISELELRSNELDPVMQQLGCALLPALEHPGRTGRLFFDHIVFAVCSHLAARYGRLEERPAGPRARLTTAQERLAKERLVSDLAEDPSIADVARACNLPVSRFIRAFRGTTGMPPHRWIRTYRVERAKDMLLNGSLALAQIAYDCGFADQSHFTRAFVKATGTPPGAWRRARRA